MQFHKTLRSSLALAFLSYHTSHPTANLGFALKTHPAFHHFSLLHSKHSCLSLLFASAFLSWLFNRAARAILLKYVLSNQSLAQNNPIILDVIQNKAKFL
jgi:hypothetical protein